MNYGKRGIKNRNKEINAYGSKISRKIGQLVLKLVIGAIAFVIVCGIAGGIGLFKSIIANTPTINIDQMIATGQASIVYDAAGNEIDQYVSMNSNRIEVEWDEISPYLRDAFVAAEDERFYQHNGIDFKSIIRAGYQFIKTHGDETQGASTITQQLLKNTIFTDWMEEGHNMVRKIKRKIQEQYLAIEVTKKTEKEEVLLRYMNAVNCGQNTLGVESASQRYFGKSAVDLSLSESAVIACITQNPSGYNPITHPENNKKRREKCLKTMLRLEMVSQDEYDEAIADSDAVYDRIGFHNTELLETEIGISSYFSDAVYEAVRDDLIAMGNEKAEAERMLNSGGLRIYTTMDPDIQQIMNEEFANPDNYSSEVHWFLDYALTITDDEGEQHNYSKEMMTKWFKEAQGQSKFNLIFEDQDSAYAALELYRTAMYEELGVTETDKNCDEAITLTAQPQVAMVIEDPHTGYVVAMMGGRGAKEGRRTLNRATDALRSPGSTFKVLGSFAPAVDAGLKTLASTYNDAPFNYTGGRAVKNWYSGYGQYGVECSIRTGIIQSLNIIAVKNLTVVGPQLGYDYCSKLGFTSITDGVVINGQIYSDVNQTLALGGLTFGVSPYELNAGYAALANGGVYCEPKLYTKVTDADGNIIIDNEAPVETRVFKETTAYLMTDAMKDVMTRGTGTAASFSGMTLAGKTGTSSKNKDFWFVGYSPYYSAATWTGYDNAIEMSTASSNREQDISKKMWKAIMSRVHADLPNVSFVEPEGIVTREVCSKSGLLATDLCREFGCAYTEKFAEDNAPDPENPEDYCNLHYQGTICYYCNRIANPNCPFQATDTKVQLPLPEEPELVEGSTQIIEDENGNETYIQPVTSVYCVHNDEFFANPDYQSVIDGQRWEMQAAWEAAQANQGN
ncbi:MAG: transglycosylase domain-containing protein [Lachnospiraceae bacterium]|nr:transglycosylase domain-containing protein [Lachnospiraceae bacterium]